MERTIGRPSTAEFTDSAHGALPSFALWTAVAVQFVLLPVTLGTAAVLSEYYDVSASGWAVSTCYVSWTVAAVLLIISARRRPILTPLIPLTNAVLLVCIVTFGVNVVGWHA